MSHQRIFTTTAKLILSNAHKTKNIPVLTACAVCRPFCKYSQPLLSRGFCTGYKNGREASQAVGDPSFTQRQSQKGFDSPNSDSCCTQSFCVAWRATLGKSSHVTNKTKLPIATRRLHQLHRKRQEHVQNHIGNRGEDLQDLKAPASGMTSGTPDADSAEPTPKSSSPAQHKPLVVGRTKPPQPDSTANMDASNPETKAALNSAMNENIKSNTSEAGPAAETPPPQSTASSSAKKKEKTPKQPKAPKSAPAAAPLSPALLDLRVGHILRAINHPNADSLYVSTIAMGDPEGTEHTQIDDETGKVVRTVCSGLNGLVPLSEMQDRKVVVVANLKPVNMRSIKSAAMVLAASPPAPEGSDPHAADRVVELVSPPATSEAGDKVFFEGWPYGEGKGPEKQLNPKKKQWEAIQPGFFTGEDCIVGFDSGKSEIEGTEKGELILEGGKGKCTVKSLKGAVVR